VAQFVFGPYRLDPEGVALWREREIVSVRPKCFALLLYLIQHHGKLITKETLLADVWKDVVVSESALSRTVAELRDILQDNAEAPQFIETAQRRGYKFIGKVVEIGKEVFAPRSRVSLVYRGIEFPLDDGSHLIGRGRDVAIVLHGAAISRHHARISVQGKTILLQDLESQNGTFVNGNRVTGPQSLRAGDRIEIGGEMLVVSSPTAETIPPPA
jgi:DNA-binding winged helix-turn-helix (wHTH) protein